MKNNIHTNLIFYPKIILFLVLLGPIVVFAQKEIDTNITNPLPVDSSVAQTQIDTSKVDESYIDTLISKDALTSKLNYKAKDSIRFDLKNQLVFLYGSAEVYYEDIELKAEEIQIDMDSNLVIAKGKQDSLGIFYGEPIMKEAGKEFNSHEIKYNYKTKKGLITEVMTHEGESYIHGKKVYKTPDNILYIRNGKYTTCNERHPHYYFNTPKLKIIPKDKIVTGPANLYISDVPTPLAIPFGFFPNSNKQKSGLIIPEPGESNLYGFFLLGGGYYLGINDNLNVQLLGDFYSRGSWATNLISNYKKRYGYSGNIDVKYSIFEDGIEGVPGFAQNKDFFFRWNHKQDPKARPNSVFSATVNFGTSENFTNNFNSTGTDYLSSVFNSNISYKKSWAGKPYNLSINASHTQNTQTRVVTVRLPDIAFNVSRINPFKKKITVGKQRFYEKIGLSYSLNTRNEVTAGDSLFSFNTFNELSDRFKNGLRHSIPITTSFKVLKNFTVTPAVNYSELWYISSIRRNFNANSNTLETDTVTGFVRGNTYNTNITLTTKVYGIYQYKGKVIKALRHVITPSIGFRYTPENNSGLRSYVDENNEEVEYSIFENGIYGTTNSSKAGVINLGLINNFEMKVRNRKDSLGEDKKIKLIENLGFSSNYNLNADSLNWSNISINARTNIFKKVSLNFNGTLDPYALDSSGTKINTAEWTINRRVGRLTSANMAVSFALKSKQKTDKEKKSAFGTEEELEYINSNPEDFIDFNVPWTLKFNYNVRYSKPQFESSVVQTLGFSGDFSLTPKWKVGFTSGYDFEAKDLSYTSIDFYRDLHCWEMSFNWVPTGPRQSYLFTIKVKSAILQDLKLTRRNLPNVF